MNSEQAIAQLRGLLTESDAAMKRGELKAANLIADDAKSAAPGSLPSKIFVTQDETATTVIGGDELSAYLEFGTGNFAKEYVANLPEEVRQEALKFFVSGKGRGAAQPFFFPSIFRHQPDILIAIEEELSKLAK